MSGTGVVEAAAVGASAASRRLAAGLPDRSPLRQAVTAACRRPESECVAALLDQARLSPEAARRVA